MIIQRFIQYRKSLQRTALLLSPVLLIIFQTVKAQSFNWASDYPVGTRIPALEAPDQHGSLQTLDTLTGEAGLLLVFNRSFDWCPYCKTQLKGLVEAEEQFRSLGIEIATVTYDSEEVLQLAAEDFGVNFALLRDIDRKLVDAFGILNTDYSPGDFAYGIPRPGIMLIDPQGLIQVKFAEENHRIRPDWSDVLEAAEYMQGESE